MGESGFDDKRFGDKVAAKVVDLFGTDAGRVMPDLFLTQNQLRVLLRFRSYDFNYWVEETTPKRFSESINGLMNEEVHLYQMSRVIRWALDRLENMDKDET